MKSNYFTLRPQLLQLYQNNHLTFRGRIEDAVDAVENQIARDYKRLVNETNRAYLSSRYPLEEIARTVGIQPSVRRFTDSKSKLDQTKQLTLTIPGATQKFTGLEQLSQTYTRTSESKLINVYHFMRRLQDKMHSDSDFIQYILKNNSRSHSKVTTILGRKSIP